MSKQSIGLGTVADDGTGDTLRAAGDKVNDNFDEIYARLGDGTDLGVMGGGLTSGVYDAGTKTTGTYTPAPTSAVQNFQKYINGGAHTLAPPAASCRVFIHVTNNGSAGAITTSGFTKVTGDSLTTTDTHAFILQITKVNTASHLAVTALQ